MIFVPTVLCALEMRGYFCFLALAVHGASSFQNGYVTSRIPRAVTSPEHHHLSSTGLYANEREDFLPETSFGAEVVPEGQRPVNEYLEMRRAPLFDWASNERGTGGVSKRSGGQ